MQCTPRTHRCRPLAAQNTRRPPLADSACRHALLGRFPVGSGKPYDGFKPLGGQETAGRLYDSGSEAHCATTGGTRGLLTNLI